MPKAWPEPMFQFWAKSGQDGGPMHSVPHHILDVAASAIALLAAYRPPVEVARNIGRARRAARCRQVRAAVSGESREAVAALARAVCVTPAGFSRRRRLCHAARSAGRAGSTALRAVAAH